MVAIQVVLATAWIFPTMALTSTYQAMVKPVRRRHQVHFFMYLKQPKYTAGLQGLVPVTGRKVLCQRVVQAMNTRLIR